MGNAASIFSAVVTPQVSGPMARTCSIQAVESQIGRFRPRVDRCEIFLTALTAAFGANLAYVQPAFSGTDCDVPPHSTAAATRVFIFRRLPSSCSPVHDHGSAGEDRLSHQS